MAKKLFTTSQLKRITGAKHIEKVQIPFYYAPPFLDAIKQHIKERLSSRGGRPTIQGSDVLRKIRFSEKDWKELVLLAEHLSNNGSINIAPAQVASLILEEAFSNIKIHGNKDNEEEKTNRASKARGAS